jgi:EAL domain-containing protein (putative c-di-GMP-specific phosphodiesterase class I)
LANSDGAELDLPVVPKPFGEKPLRTFALVIGLPAFLFYVLSAVLVVGALAVMSGDIDKAEYDRGLVAMHAALNGFLNDLANAVSDEGTWNEAYLNVVSNSDAAWMDQTWGETARIGQSYDNVLVTDADGNILFGENNLGPLTGKIATYYKAAPAMLDKLNKGIGATGDATTVSQFAADNAGMAGLAAISIHQSSPGTMTVPRQTRRVLWIARHLTTPILQDISTHYQLPLAMLVDVPGDDTSSIQVADATGKVAGTVAWISERPGAAAFDHAIIIAFGIFFLIGVMLAAGLGALRRAMVRRAKRIGEAEEARGAAIALKAAARNRRGGDIHEDEALQFGAAAINFPELEGVRPSVFAVDYQPAFDVRAETLAGVEALLRWELSAERNLPEEQLSAAARRALLDRVGVHAIRQATVELAPLIGTVLTLGVTDHQLGNPEYAEKVLGTMGATNYPAQRLQLALDCGFLPEPDAIAETVATLRDAGVRLVLDRFVLVPATIELIARGWVDRVRLSPALTRDLDQSPARLKLIAATIETLREARIAITAPGVDRREDLARLVRFGCTEFQGALFAPPMPIKALTQLLLAPPIKRAS